MKAEEQLKLLVNEPDFLSKSGSRLYGTSTPTSDYDLRGFVLPPYEYLVGLKTFNDMELEGDHKVYSVKRYLELVLRGDPQCTELLFADYDSIEYISSVGEIIMSLKDDLVSNVIYNRIMGYSIGEWRKAMAIRLVSVERNKTKKEIINDVRNHWKLDKEKMDSIIKIFDSVDEKKCISSMAGLGVKRKKEVEEHGYCRKSATHSIRLVTQLTELLLTGNIIFPRPNADFLLDIRHGKYSKDELEEIHNEVDAIAKEAKEKSVLPEKPNSGKVWKVYEKIVVDFLNKDERFNNLIGE